CRSPAICAKLRPTFFHICVRSTDRARRRSPSSRCRAPVSARRSTTDWRAPPPRVTKTRRAISFPLMDTRPLPLSPELLDRFAAIVGDKNALTDPADIAPYVEERRGRFPGVTPLVLRPADAGEVSRIMRLA